MVLHIYLQAAPHHTRKMASYSDTGINLSESFGPLFWGFVISLLLCGITIVQAYIYFPAHKDPPIVRWTAFTMIIFDLTSSALYAQSVYHYLIPHFGSLTRFASITPEISAECLFSALITFNSQMYFVYQLHSVKRLGTTTWIVIGSIAACAVLALGGGIACVVSMYIFHNGVLSHRNNFFAIGFGLAKGFGALTDILATIAMCVYLTSSKTGIAETNTLLNKLIQFVVQRGALVTLVQTLLVITFYAAPNHVYWLAFHINVTKLYANTFFAMLNGRHHLKEQLTHSKWSHSFGSAPSQRVCNKDYDLYQIEAQSSDSTKPFNMPTVTKSVVVANI